MIDGKFVGKQVMRMAGLKGGFRPLSSPENQAAFKELVKVLMTARTQEHAEYVIDEIMHTGDSCPTPGALRTLVYTYREQFGQDAKRGCEHCIDGWTRVFLLVDMNGGHPDVKTAQRLNEQQYKGLIGKVNPKTQCLYDAVEKCQCAGGPRRPIDVKPAGPATQLLATAREQSRKERE